MATLRETVMEIHKLKMSGLYIPLKYCEKNGNNLAINVNFVLKNKTRLILSNPNEQVIHEFMEAIPQTISQDIKWVKEKGLSTQDMRNKLYEIGVTRREIMDLAIKKVEYFVDKIIKIHESCSDEPDWHLDRLKLKLLLPIYRVYVYQGELIERGPKPADALAVRDLKRVRVVEKSMIDADEQCSICFEKLVDEQEQFIVLPCEHDFHEDCVTQWLKISNMCPLCRFELPSAQEIGSTSCDP